MNVAYYKDILPKENRKSRLYSFTAFLSWITELNYQKLGTSGDKIYRGW